ncbi:MAG: hypothetical protein IID32_02165 [Planctomycetes bacterium]|nr:hypothetical protein [Planctomycetota bacterium]
MVKRLKESVEDAAYRARRRRFLQRLVVPIVLAVVLVMVVLVGRERVARQAYDVFLEKISAMIIEYRSGHDGQFPSQEELTSFELKARNLTLWEVHYNGDRILNESPPDTILLYTPYLDLWFYPSGHAVLYLDLDGKTAWLGREELEQKLLEDKQDYNRRVLH